MFCKNCGTEIDDKSVICPNCGEDLLIDDIEEFDDFAEEAEQEAAVPVSEAAKAYAEVNEDIRKAKLDEIKRRRDEKRKKEQKKRIVAVAVLVAVIVAAAGGVLAWLNFNYGDNVKVEEPKTTLVPITATEEPIATPTPLPTMVPSETPAPSETAAPTAAATTAPTKAPTKKPTQAPTKAPQTSSPVTMGTAITNKYVKFDKVHVSKTTGRYLVSFKMGNTTYYANVNYGTSNEQVSGKYYYITAHPTGAVYNGLPVYEITSMSQKSAAAQTASKPVASSADYILPNSSTGYVTDAQLKSLTASELNIAKNEIYARHGREFKNESLQKYFNSKSWYKKNPNYNYANDSDNLTELEKTNLLKILNFKK